MRIAQAPEVTWRMHSAARIALLLALYLGLALLPLALAAAQDLPPRPWVD
jgi:hypothetical protein